MMQPMPTDHYMSKMPVKWTMKTHQSYLLLQPNHSVHMQFHLSVSAHFITSKLCT